MAHRSHLFSLRVAHAVREACLNEKYDRSRFFKDLLAGLSTGVIALPLAMALAIASGVPPQYGLYTVIIAGLIIALTGGSRFSISGPTAAFVVLLHPIAQHYGLRGLLVTSVMAGVILIAMAIARLGRFIEYIPESVTLGFTAGIAVVIAILQVPDFLGSSQLGGSQADGGKVSLFFRGLSHAQGPSVAVAILTAVTMIIWPKLKTRIPPHLPAVLIGSALAFVLNDHGARVATIGSRFSYVQPDGSSASGIPPYFPSFTWPWLQPGPPFSTAPFDWELISQLFPAAFAIALLGAIESLLCAVVLDGMSGKRHSANSELLGQGLGNIIAPFFGGITATAAIARSAANYRAGAESPIAGAVHALFVLASVVLLAPTMAYLAMPAMASLLMIVAWNMSELPKSIHLIKTASRADIVQLLTCFSLTVVFDMVVAITVGVLLAAVLFMRELAQLTTLTQLNESEPPNQFKLPPGWQVYRVSGPLFFAAADRIFSELALKSVRSRGVVLQIDAVPFLDAGGTAALSKLIVHFKLNGRRLVLAEVQAQPLETLIRARIFAVEGVLGFASSLSDALASIDAGPHVELPTHR